MFNSFAVTSKIVWMVDRYWQGRDVYFIHFILFSLKTIMSFGLHILEEAKKKVLLGFKLRHSVALGFFTHGLHVVLMSYYTLEMFVFLDHLWRVEGVFLKLFL